MWTGVVKYQDPRTETYLGSPSILRLPDGTLLATHDYFGRRAPLDHDGRIHLSSVYRSGDDGRTWTYITHISGAFWSSLFHHNGAVYLLGTSAKSGHIVIRRSEDGGYTWTHPADGESGLLFPAGPARGRAQLPLRAGARACTRRPHLAGIRGQIHHTVVPELPCVRDQRTRRRRPVECGELDHDEQARVRPGDRPARVRHGARIHQLA